MLLSETMCPNHGPQQTDTCYISVVLFYFYLENFEYLYVNAASGSYERCCVQNESYSFLRIVSIVILKGIQIHITICIQ